jgi:hypothetical protein
LLAETVRSRFKTFADKRDVCVPFPGDNTHTSADYEHKYDTQEQRDIEVGDDCSGVQGHFRENWEHPAKARDKKLTELKKRRLALEDHARLTYRSPRRRL